jgi:hypothetical protein
MSSDWGSTKALVCEGRVEVTSVIVTGEAKIAVISSLQFHDGGVAEAERSCSLGSPVNELGEDNRACPTMGHDCCRLSGLYDLFHNSFGPIPKVDIGFSSRRPKLNPRDLKALRFSNDPVVKF